MPTAVAGPSHPELAEHVRRQQQPGNLPPGRYGRSPPASAYVATWRDETYQRGRGRELGLAPLELTDHSQNLRLCSGDRRHAEGAGSCSIGELRQPSSGSCKLVTYGLQGVTVGLRALDRLDVVWLRQVAQDHALGQLLEVGLLNPDAALAALVGVDLVPSRDEDRLRTHLANSDPR